MEPDRERHRRQYPKWKSSSHPVDLISAGDYKTDISGSEFASNDDRNYDNSQPVARPTPGIIPHTTIPTPASAPTSTPIPTSKSFHIQPRAPQQIRTQTITTFYLETVTHNGILMTHVVPETKGILVDDSRAGTMVVTSVQERTVVSTVTSVPTFGVETNTGTGQSAPMSSGAVAGLIVGIIVAITGAGAFLYICLQRKKDKKREQEQEQMRSQPLHTIMSPPQIQHQFYAPNFLPAHQSHLSTQYQPPPSHHSRMPSPFQQPSIFLNQPSPYPHPNQLPSHQHPAYRPESIHLPATVTQIPNNLDSRFGSVNSQSTPSHLRQTSLDLRNQQTDALIIGQNGVPQISEHSSNDSRTGSNHESGPPRVLSPVSLQSPKFQGQGPGSPQASRRTPTPVQQSPHLQFQQLAHIHQPQPQQQFTSPQLLFDSGSPQPLSPSLSLNNPQSPAAKSPMPISRNNSNSEYNTIGQNLNLAAADNQGLYSCFANTHGYRLGQEGMHTPVQASEVSPSMYDSGIRSPSPMESNSQASGASAVDRAYDNWNNRNKRASQGLVINLEDHEESVITDGPEK